MVPSQCSYLQDIFELGEVIEYLDEILVVQSKNFSLGLSILNAPVLVLVSDFEDVACVANVAAFIEIN